jgi:Rha family phage regulatory protein
MNQLIKDQFGVTERKGVPITSTRNIAQIFNKNHDDVLKSVRSLLEGLGEISESGWKTNFTETFYKNAQNKKQPEYLLTKKGFTLLAVGFTGKKALQFKIAYIDRFEEMESFIKSLSAAKLEFPEFTQAILMAHDEPKHYHFSNEINMINRIVLGMDAKGFKEVNGIDPKVSSIRPYLATHQIKAIEALQKFDIGLNATEPEYERRKQILTGYYGRLQSFKRLTA